MSHGKLSESVAPLQDIWQRILSASFPSSWGWRLLICNLQHFCWIVFGLKHVLASCIRGWVSIVLCFLYYVWLERCVFASEIQYFFIVETFGTGWGISMRQNDGCTLFGNLDFGAERNWGHAESALETSFAYCFEECCEPERQPSSCR